MSKTPVRKTPASAPAWVFARGELLRFAELHVRFARWHYGDNLTGLGSMHARCVSDLLLLARFLGAVRDVGAHGGQPKQPRPADEQVTQWRADLREFAKYYTGPEYAPVRRLIARMLRVDWLDPDAWLKPLPLPSRASVASTSSTSG